VIGSHTSTLIERSGRPAVYTVGKEAIAPQFIGHHASQGFARSSTLFR
jgi:hypothetical protein